MTRQDAIDALEQLAGQLLDAIDETAAGGFPDVAGKLDRIREDVLQVRSEMDRCAVRPAAESHPWYVPAFPR